jgi:hypothetical protein
MGKLTVPRPAVGERDFTVKLVRANKHLDDLEDLIVEYRSTAGVKLRRVMHRRKIGWELQIEKPPPAQMALVLGDYLYNVRSALDYLAVALLPVKHKRSAFYPILPERVWEIPEQADEPQHRSSSRERWSLIERHVDPAAVEIIKAYHPPSGRPSKTEPMHDLMVLNGLSNRDRHQNLNLVAAGVDAPTSRFEVVYEDGRVQVSDGEGAPPPFRRAFPTGARIEMPPGVASVRVSGRIVVVVEVDRQWSNVEVPHDMRRLWETACAIVGKLEPYCR